MAVVSYSYPGQTLVNEWDFIRYFEDRLLDVLKGYGARIDRREYSTLRDNVSRDRLIGHGSAGELVTEVAKLILPPGYSRIIRNKMEPEIMNGRKQHFRIFQDAMPRHEYETPDYAIMGLTEIPAVLSNIKS